MHIAVTGNIGAGKTTLTTMLSKHYGWEAQFEDVDHNPYLDDFYGDMSKWSFALQIYFLGVGFAKLKRLEKVVKISFKIEPSTKMPIFLQKTSMR